MTSSSISDILNPTRNPTHYIQNISAPFSIGNVTICPFTFTKMAGSVMVYGGCTLISNSVLKDLTVGDTALSAYICGIGEAMVNYTMLVQAGILNVEKKSNISEVIPGAETSVTFFSTKDFKGSKFTYTSGFHPYLDKINLSDIIKSLIFKSIAAPKINFPEECHSKEKL